MGGAVAHTAVSNYGAAFTDDVFLFCSALVPELGGGDWYLENQWHIDDGVTSIAGAVYNWYHAFGRMVRLKPKCWDQRLGCVS